MRALTILCLEQSTLQNVLAVLSTVGLMPFRLHVLLTSGTVQKWLLAENLMISFIRYVAVYLADTAVDCLSHQPLLHVC